LSDYALTEDPYCYPGTAVLKNIPGLQSQNELDEFEAAATTQRADEPLPRGRLSVAHYLAIHRHIFQDVFAWAGKPRTVRLSKGGSAFCYPEHVDRELRRAFAGLKAKRRLRGLSADTFAVESAAFLATLNAVHPFREGNGRTQMIFLVMLAHQAGHPLDLDRVEPKSFLDAMVASFQGDTTTLAARIRSLMG
jgi:cell filamentation protein